MQGGEVSSSRGEVLDVLQDLVRIPSVNPMGKETALGGRFGEAGVAQYVENYFKSLGVPVMRQQVLPGRDNVRALLEGHPGGPLGVFQSHMDTVDIQQGHDDLLNPRIEGDKMIGRGVCDDKGCLAAMMVAFKQVVESAARPKTGILLVATADEEFRYRGVLKVLEHDLRPRYAWGIVGEPTGLDIIRGLKGSIRWKIESKGKACHSSDPDKGVNAIYGMAAILHALQEYNREVLSGLTHPVMGPPTLSVGTIHGGTGVNIVPDSCIIEIDRRLIPGEDPLEAREEVLSYLSDSETIHGLWTAHSPDCQDPPMLLDESEPVIALARRACTRCSVKPVVRTVHFGADASKMTRDGVPSILLGPGDIAQAHGPDEWVDTAELCKAVEVYRAIMEGTGRV